MDYLRSFGLVFGLTVFALSCKPSVSPETDAGTDASSGTGPIVSNAADILFVVDNSGSMAEEQENLAKNASSSSANSPDSLCDASGYANLRGYIDANQGLAEEEWDAQYRQILADCGFIERLQLYKNHFHIGVITTDMNNCDRPSGSASRTSVPQLGCLQSSQQDPNLTVLTWQTPDVANKFANIIRNVGIWGSPYEQGLRASEHFLTSGHSVADSSQCAQQRDCSGDLDDFLRSTAPNAAGDPSDSMLVVVFLTDEEDCSNDDSIDESVPGNTELCYSDPQLLTNTDHYVQFFRTIKTKPELVTLGMIAGLYDDGTGMSPSGCKEGAGGVATNTCDPAQGNSANTCSMCINGAPVCTCHPAVAAADCQGVEHPATNCCQADPAHRYYDVVTHMPLFTLETLCLDSYKDMMIGIANHLNAS